MDESSSTLSEPLPSVSRLENKVSKLLVLAVVLLLVELVSLVELPLVLELVSVLLLVGGGGGGALAPSSFIFSLKEVNSVFETLLS